MRHFSSTAAISRIFCLTGRWRRPTGRSSPATAILSPSFLSISIPSGWMSMFIRLNGRSGLLITNNQETITNTTEFEVSAIQPFFPLYQLKLTYIIATDGEEIVLIDQHAAHERILYDQLSRSPVASPSTSLGASCQSLLMPETIELNASEAMVLKDNLDYLSSLGFEIEEFGGNSYLLRAVPVVSSKVPARQLIRDIIADIEAAGKSPQIEIRRENIRKYVACHSAIKAGDKLTQGEMDRLIRDLFATQNPLTCPHGRPTMIRLSEEELQKRFGR